MTSTPPPPFCRLTDDDLAALIDAPGAPPIPAAHREAVIETLRGLRVHAAILASAVDGASVTSGADETFVP